MSINRLSSKPQSTGKYDFKPSGTIRYIVPKQGKREDRMHESSQFFQVSPIKNGVKLIAQANVNPLRLKEEKNKKKLQQPQVLINAMGSQLSQEVNMAN